MINDSFERILISRTDNIGDVILTIPLAGAIKRYYPNSKVLFLGKKYTKPIIDCCEFIDEFYDWDDIRKNQEKINCDTIIHVFPNKEIAKYAYNLKVKNRVGTSRRIYHWFYCNKKINLSRKNSILHESQLNLKLLNSININDEFNLSEIINFYGFNKIKKSSKENLNLIDRKKFNLILHPKSKGSAREWSAQNFVDLANSLPKENFNIFISGTEEEKQFIKNNILNKSPHVKNISGLFNLSEFIAFIKECDGLIAASTGPLHIAAALGIHALGLYPPIKSMVPERWGPLGKKAEFLLGNSTVNMKSCIASCILQNNCQCINTINPQKVKNIIETWARISPS